MQDSPFDTLTNLLATLPGLGRRSAKRIVLHLLSRRESLMIPLARALENTAHDICSCHICGNLDTADPCRICQDGKRDKASLCVVAHIADLWALERTGAYRGGYHVLGGVLSALDGIGPQDLRIDSLVARLQSGRIREVILALSATVDGQSTAHYISDHLRDLPVKITRLAHGMPVGGELDYLDDGTISTALKSRASL